MLDISICIVNWNVKDLLRACLSSIYKNTRDLTFEVIVVDNASKDGSVEMIANEFPQVKLIANDTNAGFTKANNQAIAIAKCKYVMLLNPDTELKDNSPLKMMRFMEAHGNCGALGCKLLNSDGTLQRSCKTFPSMDVMIYSTLFLDQLFPGSRIFGKHFMTWWDFSSTREVDQPMGSALMIKKYVLDKVGGFDEKIFIWFDEVDLCYRIKKSGWKIFFTPDTEITHHLSKSFKQWKSLGQVLRGTYLWRKARNYFFRKHKGLLSVAVLWILDALQLALVAAVIYIPVKLVIALFTRLF